MLDAQLLSILCCPETHQPLGIAPAELITSLNSKIELGVLKNRSGESVRERIEAALLREDGKAAYLIRKGIPVMLIDQAVAIS
jgi:uncharacterized protein YbaR (Trm112 family)